MVWCKVKTRTRVRAECRAWLQRGDQGQGLGPGQEADVTLSSSALDLKGKTQDLPAVTGASYQRNRIHESLKAVEECSVEHRRVV